MNSNRNKIISSLQEAEKVKVIYPWPQAELPQTIQDRCFFFFYVK
jgi:hypothetical protein